MNSAERLSMALNHTEPDRVPYDLAGTTVSGITRRAFNKAMNYRNLSTAVEVSEVDPIQQIVTPVEETLVYLNSDVRRMGARRIPDYEKILRKNGSVLELTDVWNCLWRMDEKKDFYFNQVTYPLQNYQTIGEGLKHYKVPDISVHAEIIRNDLSRQKENISGSGIIMDRNCAGLTETSLRIRGYENWYIDTMTDPAGVEELLDVVLRYKYQYWDLVADWISENNFQGKIHVAAECDDLGSQASTILEPDYLLKTVVPRFAGLWSHIKKRIPGVKIFMHTCGAVRVLLPHLIEAGMDIYNPVQFTAAGMELAGLKKDFGKDVVFWGGGVNTQDTLKSGTPQQVSDEVKKNLDILAPGGGFIFNTVHNIQEDVPPENFWAMWQTLMDYGKY